MNLRRFLPAAALAAGIALTAGAQTPAGTDDKTKPAPPAATPPAPPSNPDVEKAIESIKKNESIELVLGHLKNAALKDGNLPPAKVMLAQIYLQVAVSNANTQQGQQAVQAARLFLEQASAEEPDHPDPFLLSGALALNESRLMDAMLCYETALAKSTRASFQTEQRKRFEKAAREGLAQTYANRRDFKGAYDQLRALLSNDPKNAKLLAQMAQLEFQSGMFDAALANLKLAYAADPAADLPEVMMGKLWDAKPKKDAAEEKDEKAKAEDFLKKALTTYPKEVKVHREYARWLLNQNRIADADAQLTAALAIVADDKECKALTGLSNRYKKQYAEGEAVFDSLNRADPNNPFFAWNLAICLAESADKIKRERAVKLAELTQLSQPKSPEAVSVLAWCLFKADRFDEAEKAMNVSAQASQGSFPPDTIYYFAKIMDKKDKSKEARDNLQKALDAKAPFVYRADAEAFQKELVAKHGPVSKPEEPKKPTEEPKKP